MLHSILFSALLLYTIKCIVYLQNWKFQLQNDSAEYPAKIPSTLALDLMDNNLTDKNPYFRDNILKYYKYETMDIVYRTNFSLPSSCGNSKHKKIVFEGLDTHCDVYLNGKKILTSHNMFRRYEVNVQLKNQNNLEIRFNSSANHDLQQEKLFQEKHGFTLPQNFSFSRKAAYQYGWDWGPRILTVGIWKPVGISCYDQIQLKQVNLQHQPITKGIKSVKSNVTAHIADLNPNHTYEMKVKFIMSGGQSSSVILPAGVKELNQTISFEQTNNVDSMIWWTNDIGKPNMFTIETTILCKNDSYSVNNLMKTGFRTVTLKQIDDSVGKSFVLNLNGYDVYMRGGNYIPPEMSMARVHHSRYQNVRKNAQFGRFNMLRLWGGGQFENDDFYNECDQAGILIWHDLMFACALYPVFSESSNINDIKQELTDNVLRIRHHPSIGLWNGNNEVWIGWQEWGWKNNKTQSQKALVQSMYNQIFQQALPQVLTKLTPSIPYWQTSPSVSSNSLSSIGSGDIHFWRVWGAGTPIQEYEQYIGRFNSEYGMQSMPAYASIILFTTIQDRHVGSYILRLHERHPKGDEYLPMYTNSYAGNTTDLERFSYFSQIMQAHALQTAIRSLRGSRPINMGSLYWQMNDVWPVSSWATVDYYNSYKAAHYRIRNLHSLLMIHTVYDKSKRFYNIYVVNDALETEPTYSIIQVIDFEGNIIRHHVAQKTVVGLSKEVVFRFNEEQFKELNLKKTFIHMHVQTISNISNYNNYFFVKPSQREIIDPALTTVVNETHISITASNALANYVWIRKKNNAIVNFEDNFFDLPKGQEKVIKNTEKVSMFDIVVTSYQNQRLKEKQNSVNLQID